MTRIVRRPLAVSPLALFVLGVLLMDAVAVGAVFAVILRGTVLGDWFAFYTGGTIIRTGHAAHLYDASVQVATEHALLGPNIKAMGYTLPLFVALVFAPLSRLSLTVSYLVWFTANLAVLAVLLRLAWSWLAEIPSAFRTVFLVCAGSIAALSVILAGQVDLFVLAGFAGCYALLLSGRPFASGSTLALALFKPHLVAGVVLLLLVKRQWRVLAGFAAVGGILLIGPALVLGPQLLVDQVRMLLSFTNTTTNFGVNAGMMINIRGTITSVTGSSNVWLWLPPLALIAGVAFYVAVRVWRSRPALHVQSWALAFMLPLLYSPHLHAQTLVLLLAAAALYLVASQSSPQPITNIKYVMYPLVAVTTLWALSLWGVSLLAFLLMGAYSLFARRWPEPATAAIALPERDELALAS